MSVGIGDVAPLFIRDNSVFLIASTSPNEPLSLLRIGISDNQTLWTHPAYNAKLAYNSKYLFIGEKGVVTAVDMNSGEQVWRTQLPVSKAISYIAANGEDVSVDVIPTYFYAIDANTGQISLSTSSTQDRPYFYGYHETLEFHVAARSVWAEDKESGETIWKESLGLTLIESPLLSNDLLLVKEGQIGSVYAFDTATGAVVWQSQEKAVSNVVVDNSIGYFLTMNAQLLALNAETGQLLAALNFLPQTLNEPFERGYYVAAHNGMVAVYFGDSRELFLLRYTGTE